MFALVKKAIALPRLFGSILLVLFASVLFNNLAFRHSHLLPSGQVISHAHPYSNSLPFPDHAHQDLELGLLDLISNASMVLTAPAAASLCALPFVVSVTLQPGVEPHACSVACRLQALRAPPVA
jgi:hypothetical protein